MIAGVIELVPLLNEKVFVFCPFIVLSTLQESEGKLSIGDEIVAIGDKQVCSSSYQEICELMHNLPLMLSLEVKRPVSGETLLNGTVSCSTSECKHFDNPTLRFLYCN